MTIMCCTWLICRCVCKSFIYCSYAQAFGIGNSFTTAIPKSSICELLLFPSNFAATPEPAVFFIIIYFNQFVVNKDATSMEKPRLAPDQSRKPGLLLLFYFFAFALTASLSDDTYPLSAARYALIL